MQFEYLDHTADVQIHSWGESAEVAFEQQVLGIMGLITERDTVRVPVGVPGDEGEMEVDDGDRGIGWRGVEAEGHDLQSLLYNFLDAWLFQFNAESFICRRVRITSLDRAAWRIASVGVGETFELGRHPQGIEVKAITYSAMRVTEAEGRCDVLVIVDV